MCSEDLKRFVREGDRVITLPVPFGAVVYSPVIEREYSDIEYLVCSPSTSNDFVVRVKTNTLKLSNIEKVLYKWGTEFFCTADEARTQGEIFLREFHSLRECGELVFIPQDIENYLTRNKGGENDV